MEHLRQVRDVHHARNTGMPTGRETQGIGVLVVLSGWESQLHGEAGQVNTKGNASEAVVMTFALRESTGDTGEPCAVKVACTVRRGLVGKVLFDTVTRWLATLREDFSVHQAQYSFEGAVKSPYPRR